MHLIYLETPSQKGQVRDQIRNCWERAQIDWKKENRNFVREKRFREWLTSYMVINWHMCCTSISHNAILHPGIMLRCNELHCAVLNHRIVVHYYAPHCTTLYCTVLYCTAMHCIAQVLFKVILSYCTIIHRIALDYYYYTHTHTHTHSTSHWTHCRSLRRAEQWWLREDREPVQLQQ